VALIVKPRYHGLGYGLMTSLMNFAGFVFPVGMTPLEDSGGQDGTRHIVYALLATACVAVGVCILLWWTDRAQGGALQNTLVTAADEDATDKAHLYLPGGVEDDDDGGTAVKAGSNTAQPASPGADASTNAKPAANTGTHALPERRRSSATSGKRLGARRHSSLIAMIAKGGALIEVEDFTDDDDDQNELALKQMQDLTAAKATAPSVIGTTRVTVATASNTTSEGTSATYPFRHPSTSPASGSVLSQSMSPRVDHHFSNTAAVSPLTAQTMWSSPTSRTSTQVLEPSPHSAYRPYNASPVRNIVASRMGKAGAAIMGQSAYQHTPAYQSTATYQPTPAYQHTPTFRSSLQQDAASVPGYIHNEPPARYGDRRVIL